MRTAFSVLATSFLVLLFGCGDKKRSSPDALQPPTGSGAVATDLGGPWRITQVDPQLWVTHPGADRDQAPAPRGGLMPPTVGATITIAGGEFTNGNGLIMRREETSRWSIITSYLNRVDDRIGLYTMRQHTAPIMLDGGSSILQLAVGTIDRDHLLGLIYHRVSNPFIQPGEPIEVMALIQLERVQ